MTNCREKTSGVKQKKCPYCGSVILEGECIMLMSVEVCRKNACIIQTLRQKVNSLSRLIPLNLGNKICANINQKKVCEILLELKKIHQNNIDEFAQNGDLLYNEKFIQDEKTLVEIIFLFQQKNHVNFSINMPSYLLKQVEQMPVAI
ncbi:MAG: hypothetical protein Q8Q23_05705 [bacterium]|nr:hypothetical protein [bacterium]